MSDIPKTAIAAICIVVAATIIRGLLGVSLLAGILISAIAVVWWGAAIAGTLRSMRIFSAVLGIYGGAFVAQALLLPRYVGSREIDVVWGTVLVLAGLFLYTSPAMKVYFVARKLTAGSDGAKNA